MPVMQRAHGRNQRDPVPAAALSAIPKAGDRFPQKRKFTDDLHVDQGSDKAGPCLPGLLCSDKG
jgi:hypothetical protein